MLLKRNKLALFFKCMNVKINSCGVFIQRCSQNEFLIDSTKECASVQSIYSHIILKLDDGKLQLSSCQVNWISWVRICSVSRG